MVLSYILALPVGWGLNMSKVNSRQMWCELKEKEDQSNKVCLPVLSYRAPVCRNESNPRNSPVLPSRGSVVYHKAKQSLLELIKQIKCLLFVNCQTDTQWRSIFSHNDLHWGDYLLGHRRGHRSGVDCTVRVAPQVVDQLLREITTH